MAEEEDRQRRYHEFVENLTKKNSNITTSNTSVQSFGPSSEINNIANQFQDQGKSNQTLLIKKFYGVNIRPQSSADSVYASSNASVFKLPQSTKEFAQWHKYESALDAFMKLIRACSNKITIKLFMKFLQEFTQVTDLDDIPYDPICFLEQCVHKVKNNHYAGKIAPSVSSVSSRTADQASTTGSRYVPFLRPEHSVHQACGSINQSYRPNNRGSQQESSIFRKQEQDMLLPHEESSVGLSLFNDTEQAQQRDELAALQHPDDTVMKKRPTKRATVSSTRPGSNKATENRSIINKNDTLALKKMGAKAVSRTGRLIKSPVQFWKGNESRINDTINERKPVSREKKDKVDLNESMTLRSNKVLQPTPVKVLPKKRGRPNTSLKPLTTISENKKDNDNKTFKNPLPPKNNKISKKQDKENSTLHVTKNNVTEQISKTNNTKIATMKQAESKTEKPQKAVKKRKSKNAKNSVCKRKKIEEDLLSESLENQFSEDELFGRVGFKKRPIIALQAVSPSKVQLLSVKKALATSSSKETPPCKTLGQMIDVSGFSSTSHSTVKELPDTKATRVVKRMTKVTENKVADKPKNKEVKGSKTALGSYTTTTPLSQNAVFTMFSSIDDDSDAWSEGSSANNDDDDLL